MGGSYTSYMPWGNFVSQELLPGCFPELLDVEISADATNAGGFVEDSEIADEAGEAK